MFMRWIIALASLLWASSAQAQNLVVQNCGTLPQNYAAGSTQPPTVDTNGKLCTNAFAVPFAGYIVNNWYRAAGNYSAVGSGGANSVDVISCIFGGVSQKATLSNIGLRNTSSVAGSNAQLAIYNTGTNFLPGRLIANTGSINIAVAGFPTAALTPNPQVGPGGSSGSGALWFCSNVDSPGTTFITTPPTSQSMTQTSGSPTVSEVGSATAVQAITCQGAGCTGGISTFGTWPSSLAGSTWTYTPTSSNVLPFFQIGSVP